MSTDSRSPQQMMKDRKSVLHLNRRLFLGGCALMATHLIVPPAVVASPRVHGARRLTFHHLHTGENLKAVYWENGDYLDDGLEEINHLLRDHRTNETHAIDPGLLDLLHGIQSAVGNRGEIQIISGYRSPKTNNMLRSKSGGVAKRSLHMEGRAIDIRMPRTDLKRLYKAARTQKVGGVGYYEKSGFVHVDTGRVRYW